MRMALIETTGTRDQVDGAVSRALGRNVNATQTGKHGLEVAVPAEDAETVIGALIAVGLTTETRFTGRNPT